MRTSLEIQKCFIKSKCASNRPSTFYISIRLECVITQMQAFQIIVHFLKDGAKTHIAHEHEVAG